MAQLSETKKIISAFDVEMSEKTLLVKSITDIQETYKTLRGELERLTLEYEQKDRAVKSLNNEIAAQSFALSRNNEKFEKENAERIKTLGVKEKEVASANEQYKHLVQDYTNKLNDLRNELSRINDERKIMGSEMERLHRHVSQIEAESNGRIKDVESRELILKSERQVFEDEYNAAKADMARISEIKGENKLLWQKLEDEKKSFENQLAKFEAYKLKTSEDEKVKDEKLSDKKAEVAAYKDKLTKLEQDLNDRILEADAKMAEAEDMKKRYQLTKKIEELKK